MMRLLFSMRRAFSSVSQTYRGSHFSMVGSVSALRRSLPTDFIWIASQLAYFDSICLMAFERWW